MQISADGTYAYFPWMVYADRPITTGNIREGWVLGNRVARVRLDGPGAARPWRSTPAARRWPTRTAWPCRPTKSGWPWPPRARTSWSSSVSTICRCASDGPGDHLRSDIANDAERFFRVPLGGRPMDICFDRQGTRVYVANYLSNAVQVVNLAKRRVERTIRARPAERAVAGAARRGDLLRRARSADGWYSCHSCHLRGRHQRRHDGHQERRLVRHLQDGAQPAQRRQDGPLVLARLAERLSRPRCARA